MFFRKSLAAGAAVMLGLTLAQVDAGARGGGHGGGMHAGMTSTFGHGLFGGHFFGHAFADRHGHFDEHGRDRGHDHGQDQAHDRGRGRDHNERYARFAMGGFNSWHGAALGGHFGYWRPGHWAAASGFGGGGRFSPALQGVWGK